VAGIPVIRKGILGAKGETTRTVSQFIESGKNQEALLAMVYLASQCRIGAGMVTTTSAGQGNGENQVCLKVARPDGSSLRGVLAAGPQGKTAKDFDFSFFGDKNKNTIISLSAWSAAPLGRFVVDDLDRASQTRVRFGRFGHLIAIPAQGWPSTYNRRRPGLQMRLYRQKFLATDGLCVL
jgi:hypothetical protein